MNTLKADFFSEEKVNLSLSNSEPKSVPPPRVLLTHYNVIILLAFILFTFLTFTNNAFSQPMKFLYDQIIQENNLSFINVTRTSNQITLKIDYTNLNYSIDSTENGWYINMENFGSSGIQGAPDLPYRAYTLELPNNVIFSSITTTIDSIYSAAVGNYTPFRSVVVYADTIVLDEPNEEIYNINTNYPANPISITNPSNMRNWVFLGIELYPFQYNPVTGDLLKIDSIEYVINFEVSRDSIPKDSTKVPAYCIITTQAIKDSSAKLEEFRLSKERIGFDSFVVTVDSLDICNFTDLQAPGERPERIRRYLQENYIEKNIEYVLLVGNPNPDSSEIPMKIMNTDKEIQFQPDAYSKYPTDFYYAELTGNWDLDGDERFGEINRFDTIPTPYNFITNINYSLIWKGFLDIPYVEYGGETLELNGYLFAYYNDGIRIWINDTLLNSQDPNSIYYWSDNNSWNSQIEFGCSNQKMQFKSGLYKLKIEFRNIEDDSYLKICFPSTFTPINDSIQIRYLSITQPIPSDWFKRYNSDSILVKGLLFETYNDDQFLDTLYSFTWNDSISNAWYCGDKGEGGVEFYPEINIGRIPFYNNVDTLDMLLERIINYQYTDNINWRKNALIICDSVITDSTFLTGEAINSLCTEKGFDTYRIYTKNYSSITGTENIIYPVNFDNVLNTWNNQPFSLVTWFSHGIINYDIYKNITSIVAKNIMDSSHCSQLFRDYPSIVFEGSCGLGYPESKKNLGYQVLKNNAVATISATRSSWGIDTIRFNNINLADVPNFGYNINKFLLDNVQVGSALSFVKSNAPINYITTWRNNIAFNLYGDPSLKLNSTVNTITLQNGWNFISSYLMPDRNSMNSVFRYIKNNIGIVRNQNDDVFIPDSIDEIGNWNHQEAYKIYMNTSAYFYIAGSKINPVLDTIPLNSGWNWVSYLRNSNMSIDTAYALNSIKNNLIIAKNGSGLIYVPEFHVNQIGDMLPNQGYEISVNADCNLVYPQDSSSYNYKSVLDETTILSPVAKRLTPFVTNTGNDCTLIFDKLNIPDGYEIGIINGEGVLIGAGAVQNQVCALTVWGKDDLNNTEGALKGEELFAFTIDTTNNRIQEIEITNIQDFLTKENINTLTYDKGKIYVCNANAELTAINENLYIINQPNPFNDQTEITYKIPESGNVDVNISSIQGEIVATYNQGNQEAGIYNILFDGSNLLGGVYVIDLIFENERVQSIMILIK